jgi:hypothetical protein
MDTTIPEFLRPIDLTAWGAAAPTRNRTFNLLRAPRRDPAIES